MAGRFVVKNFNHERSQRYSLRCTKVFFSAKIYKNDLNYFFEVPDKMIRIILCSDFYFVVRILFFAESIIVFIMKE
jgi:hypothetical protein